MASALSLKCFTIFCQNAQIFVHFLPCDIVQIAPGYGYLSNNVRKDFKLDNIKCPIGKSIFAVNLPSKVFGASVANTDTGSLKSLHALFEKYLDYMLTKLEANRIV